MDKIKRVFLQGIIWILFWFLLWNIREGNNGPGAIEYFSALLIQFFLISSIVFYLVPNILFKKKQLVFFLVSVVLITGMALLFSQLFQLPKIQLPPRGPSPPFSNLHPPRGLSGFRFPPRFFDQLIIFGITYVFATFWELLSFAHQKEQETIKNKSEKLQTELKLLKSQINPHFLFNSLNNIYALSVINSAGTQQSISYLSEMLRYGLYECEEASVSLEKEVNYIKNYLKLFSLKSSKPYPIETKFSISNTRISVAPMLLIPFVENALKHSYIENMKDSFIKIKIEADSDKIKLNVENSIPKEKINKDKVGGIGLENVKKRLTILYPNRHQLTMNEIDNTFNVQLYLQLNETS